ncbi:MAG: serine endoprotease DegQ, partial [Pseudomonadales bacterium]|nr:serine endoprotease DegQ [Pseudomonadales bacterium]
MRLMLIMRSFLIASMLLLGSLTSLQSVAVLPAFDSQGEALPSLAPLLQKVNPAVVNISTHTVKTVSNPLLEDPFFRRFFDVPQGQAPSRQRRTQSAGSGVIVDADGGTVVTNFHVIDGADEIIVALADNRSFT